MREKRIEGLPSEIWKHYGGTENKHIRHMDALLGKVKVVEKAMFPLILGKTTEEEEIHVNALFPTWIKRGVLPHEFGHLLRKHVEQRIKRTLNDFEEEYVAKVVEHIVKRGKLPSPYRKMEVSFTELPVRQREELLRIIKELFNLDLD